MSDDPDFIDDGPSRPKHPGFIDPQAPPSSPPTQAGGEAPFNPFANVVVDTGSTGPGAPPAGLGPVATAAATSEAAPSPSLSGDAGAADDGDLPARRDDLWTCPHCQVGNKPERDSCRSCGKSQHEPVAKPWFLRPAVLGAALAVFVVMLIIASMLGPDFSFQEPTHGNVTGSAMTDTSPARSGPDFDSPTFIPRGRIAGVGRVLAVSTQHQALHGIVSVAVLFGREGAEAELDTSLNASFQRRGVFRPNGLPAPVSYAFLHLIPPIDGFPEIRPGQIISVSGDHGEWDEEPDWGTGATLADHEYLVHPWAGLRIGAR